MRHIFWIGRRLFAVGQIFERDTPSGMRKALMYPGQLHALQIGRWGVLVINFDWRPATVRQAPFAVMEAEEE